MSHPINDLLSATIEKMREVADVNTIIGNQIITPDGTTIIPISKISVAFATGGSDYSSKGSQASNLPYCFGGGGGGGATVSPIGFITVSNGEVRMIPINEQATSTADRLVELVPEIISKIKSCFDESKTESPSNETSNGE